MKRIIKTTITYELDDTYLKDCQIISKEIVEKEVTKKIIDLYGMDEGYESVKVEVIDTE